MLLNQNNFNWDITNKELVIFVPNFGRKHLLIPTLKRFKTSVPDNKWCWLVVNDGIHEDLFDLEKEFNLKWFTFERQPADERNGALIRNYVIKRIQSRLIATKDPEIIIEGDFVSKIIDLGDVVYRPWKMIELYEQETQPIIDNPFIELTQFPVLREWIVDNKRNQAFHAGYTVTVKRLKEMGGYDERYGASYGYEDWNMLERLKKSNIPIIIDKDITTYHIAHPIIRKFHKTILSNEIIYKQDLQKLNIIANEGKDWGNG